MQGFQLTFFTQQDRKHEGKPLAHWLVEVARNMGIGGATLIAASEGFGQHRKLHSVHFFELTDQPMEVVMAVTAQECDALFARLQAEKVHLFYCKTPVEFGSIGEST